MLAGVCIIQSLCRYVVVIDVIFNVNKILKIKLSLVEVHPSPAIATARLKILLRDWNKWKMVGRLVAFIPKVVRLKKLRN